MTNKVAIENEKLKALTRRILEDEACVRKSFDGIESGLVGVELGCNKIFQPKFVCSHLNINCWLRLGCMWDGLYI